MIVLPTPTGLGLAVGFAGGGVGQPGPLVGTEELQTKLKSPFTAGPSLLTKASLGPVNVDRRGVDPGGAAVGKFPEKVSPVT